jgi:hypothetical protein
MILEIDLGDRSTYPIYYDVPYFLLSWAQGLVTPKLTVAKSSNGWHVPWNKRETRRTKAPLKLKDIWAIRALADPKPNPRTCLVQSGDRQQTEIV